MHSCFSLNIYRRAFQRLNIVSGQIEADLLPSLGLSRALQCLQRNILRAWKPSWMYGLNHLNVFPGLQKLILKYGLSLCSSGAFVCTTSDLFGLQQIHFLIINEDLHFGFDHNVKQNRKEKLLVKARA